MSHPGGNMSALFRIVVSSTLLASGLGVGLLAVPASAAKADRYLQVGPGSGADIKAGQTDSKSRKVVLAVPGSDQVELLDSKKSRFLVDRWSGSRGQSRFEVWQRKKKGSKLVRAFDWRIGGSSTYASLSGDGSALVQAANRTDLGVVLVTSTQLRGGSATVRGGFPLDSGTASAWVDAVSTVAGKGDVFVHTHFYETVNGSRSFRFSALLRFAPGAGNPSTYEVTSGTDYAGTWSVSPNGRYVLYESLDSGWNTRLVLIDRVTGVRRTKVYATADISTGAWAKNSKSFLFSVQGGAGWKNRRLIASNMKVSSLPGPGALSPVVAAP